MSTEEIWVELSEFDRLSDLPDDLLLHIMGFLTPRQAVNTCILSKRWRNLWRYLPCLHFNAHDDDNFIQFITSFFNLRSNCRIDTFQLHGLTVDDRWLATIPLVPRVLESHPRVLSIKSSCCQLYFDSIATCASVEEMELDRIFFLQRSPITLFNLKRLNLTIGCLDGECVNNLISGCPVLEELVVKHCSFLLPNVPIVSHSLKNLSFDHCDYCDDVEIHLSIPSLVSLHVTNVMLGGIWLKNMSSLVKVHIQFCYCVCSNYLNSSNELLRGLSTATYIELTGPGVGLNTGSPVKDLLVKELPTCRAFANLKTMYLRKCNMSGFLSPISQLVHVSPNLKTIKFGGEEEMMFSGTDAFISSASGNVVFLVGSIPVTIPFAQVIEAVKLTEPPTTIARRGRTEPIRRQSTTDEVVPPGFGFV